MKSGETIFFEMSEQYWGKPYPKKRSDVYDVKSVILRGEVVDTQLNQIKVKLVDNNGFERDGETYVIYQGTLLSNQNFKDFESLGKWKFNQ